MNEDRLSRKDLIVILTVGMIMAVLAVVGVSVSGLLPKASFRAQAQLAMVPAATATPESRTSAWESLGGGQAGKIVAEVIKLDATLDKAVVAVPGANAKQITVTANVVDSTSLINVTLNAPTGPQAEAVLQALIDQTKPLIQEVAGPYDVKVTQAPANTAQPGGIPASQLLIVVALGGLMVGAGAALLFVRARSRRESEAAAIGLGTGEHRRVPPSGPIERRPQASTPPRGRAPQPPPGIQQNGAYGASPRRPVDDPRANR